MKCFTFYSKCNPDTISGYKIVVTQTYTTFDEAEINQLDKHLRQTIGSGTMTEFKHTSGKEQ